MKVKPDENLGRRAQALFIERGHDVATVRGERLSSAPDPMLIESCRREGRCLVTLDLDFGNPLLFKPSEYAGIVVVRLPPKPAQADLLAAIGTLLEGLARSKVNRKLWVVQRDRIREYQEPGQEDA